MNSLTKLREFEWNEKYRVFWDLFIYAISHVENLFSKKRKKLNYLQRAHFWTRNLLKANPFKSRVPFLSRAIRSIAIKFAPEEGYSELIWTEFS